MTAGDGMIDPAVAANVSGSGAMNMLVGKAGRGHFGALNELTD